MTTSLLESRGRSFSRRERGALSDTAVALGPDAPTLCEGWTVKDLLVHLAVRDRPWLLARKAGLQAESIGDLVDRVRKPPLVLAAASPLDSAINTVEMFVHHEDLRRAQPSWEPRTLEPADDAALLRAVGLLGRVLVRPAGVPVVAAPSSGRRLTLRGGSDPVVVSGPAGELALFVFGRGATRGLAFDGPEDRVATLRSAKLGF